VTKTLSRATATCLIALLCWLPVAGLTEPASAVTQRVVLKRAVKAYSDAFLDGRGADAYRMLTGRCKARIDRDTFLQASDLAKQIYGGPMPFTSYRAAIDGRRARATYTYAARSLDQRKEPWLRTSGRWRMNEC
jgi:hypothetical protein